MAGTAAAGRPVPGTGGPATSPVQSDGVQVSPSLAPAASGTARPMPATRLSARNPVRARPPAAAPGAAEQGTVPVPVGKHGPTLSRK